MSSVTFQLVLSGCLFPLCIYGHNILDLAKPHLADGKEPTPEISLICL